MKLYKCEICGNIIEKVIELVKQGKCKEIADIRDETDRNGMRVVVELKKDANPQVVLNRLFAQTQMQTTFGVTMLALVNNQQQPKILSLRHMLDEYLTFQEEIITKRTVRSQKSARPAACAGGSAHCRGQYRRGHQDHP